MAGVLERVFPMGQLSEDLGKYRSTRFACSPSTFIIGPEHCNKTAMLVQAAVTEAAADGQVLFIAPKKVDGLPHGVHGMPQPSSSPMENVRFLYAEKERELTGYLASLHMMPAGDRPTLIIIDDFQFFTRYPNIDAAGQMVNAARILSITQESAEFCSNSPDYSASYPCSILVSWTFGSSDSIRKEELELFAKTMCHHVWSVQKKGKCEGEGNEKYHLVEEEQGHTCTLEFSLRPLPHPHLLLHWVTLDKPAEVKEAAKEETTK